MAFDRDLRDYLETWHGDDGAIAMYASENFLTTRDPVGRTERTRLGDAYLKLRGRHAVQWIVTVEVAQSTGQHDRWRAPRQLFADAMSPAGIPEQAPVASRYATESIERLLALHVIDLRGGRYRVPAPMREVVASALNPSPWRNAVEMLLSEERGAVLPGLQPHAADATIEQTRMIAHEIRNALVPVRVHLDSIVSPDGEVPLVPTVGKARKGVVRVLEFVEQMLETSELLSETTSHEATRLVREAIGRLDGGERVELIEPSTALRIHGQRRPLIIAISNVIDNALQAAAPSQPVRATLRLDGQNARIQIDDGGPGIPDADRVRVFDQRFTTRPGGSGYGLAYVKRIVEATSGKVWCERSDLGGARFVIELPADLTS